MTNSTTTAADLVQAYYDSWQHGMATFDEPRLRAILAPDLLFEGPIAGSRTGLDPFMRGLANFVSAMKSFRLVQQVHAASDSAAVYDCEVGPTAGSQRFAEFIHVENERIQSIRLVFDATEFRKLTT
jgi:ketosteroid isomerase-like protein